MFVTVIEGRDSEMSLEEIITSIRDFGGSSEYPTGQVDLNINEKHVVLSFLHYDMPDGDTHWIINRDDFVSEPALDIKELEQVLMSK